MLAGGDVAGAGARSARARPHQQVPARAAVGAERGRRRRARRADRAVPARLQAARRRRPTGISCGLAGLVSDVEAAPAASAVANRRGSSRRLAASSSAIVDPMKSSLRTKLDQLATRLAELDATCSAPRTSTRDLDRYRALTKEHAEIDAGRRALPRVRGTRRPTSPPPTSMAQRPGDARIRRRGARGGAGAHRGARGRAAGGAAAEGPERRAQRVPRNPRRHRRRRIGAVRRQPVPHVRALRRAPSLAGRDRVRVADASSAATRK